MQDRHNRVSRFLDADCFHAAKVDRTLAKETRAALDVMSQDNVIIPERPGKTGLSRAKDSHGGDSKQSSQMHRASVVRQQQTALAQFIDELIERSLTDSVHAAIA